MNTAELQLQKIRNDFAQTYLLVCIISGAISNILTSFRDYPDIFTFLFFSRTIFLIICIVVYVQQDRFSTSQRFYIVSIFVTVIYCISITKFGIFSPMKWYPLIISFGLVFFFTFRTVLGFTGLSLIVLFASAFLLGSSATAYPSPLPELYTNPFHWIADLIFLALGPIVGIYSIYHFRRVLNDAIHEGNLRKQELNEARSAILHLNDNLSATIEEKVSVLKQVVVKLNDQNAELMDLNESIDAQNKEVEVSTALLKSTRQRMVNSERLATVGLFTAGVCHEIKNPLSQLISCREILAKRVKVMPEYSSMDRLFIAMEVGMDRIKNVIDRLNRYRDNTSRPVVQTNVLEQLRLCMNDIQPSVEGRVHLTLDAVSDQLFVNIEADDLILIIRNILANSIESITDKGSVNMLTFSGSGKVVVEFSDDGCGIPVADLDLVTNPFFTTKSADGHVGLGLYQVQAIMNDCGGQVLLDSVPEKGTIVRLTFISSPAAHE